MVELMKSGDLLPELDNTSLRDRMPIKLEIEDPLEEEHGPLTKRAKPSSAIHEQWTAGTLSTPDPLPQYNPLDEPSPLGLQLRKSPSLLDLIQMKLSQGSIPKEEVTENKKSSSEDKRGRKSAAVLGVTDKLKASNFPASLLKIGCWEYTSRYEGDLVAKCYFAKHKLVWEVLDGGLKSKIEIQWSDIMALQANCSDNGPSTLTVVLARQPLFFKETTPQPRKHTLWQATSDFTDGQASRHRKHFLQCPQGLLSKHFEKLIQCDMRLNILSQQQEIVLYSPYFDSLTSVFEGIDGSVDHDVNCVQTGKGSTSSGFLDRQSPSVSQSSTGNDVTLEPQSRDALSPSSGSGGSEIVDFKGYRNWDQIKVPGFRPSMSLSDFMSQIGQCISEQMNSGNPSFSVVPECQEILEDIAHYLLNDNQLITTSDEKLLMSRVNSFCCLLQKDPSAQIVGETACEGRDGGKHVKLEDTNGSIEDNDHNITGNAPQEETDFSFDKKAVGMSRKDSFVDLLLQLPRIASLPKFLFNISEDGESHGR